MTRLRRRKLANRFAEGMATAAALAAVGVLGIVVVSVLLRGLPALDWSFLTQNQATFGQAGGGIANAIVGSIVLVAVATALALPVGVLVAVYINELAPAAVARVVRTTLDLLNGVPSIVIGIFVFSLLVLGHQQSGFAGSVGLAIVMLPLVARSAQEVLALVPGSLREASLALGVSRWRTVVSVVLPASFSGVLTGATLAVARAAGETAPLLFTTSVVANATSWDPSKPLNSLPLVIFTYSESPDPAQHRQAWAAAFLLIAFVLVTSLAARALFARSRRRLAGP
jgi:phosphate transport system permease protein